MKDYLLWVWRYILKRMVIGAITMIVSAGLVAILTTDLMMKALIGLFGVLLLWLFGIWAEYAWTQLRNDFDCLRGK